MAGAFITIEGDTKTLEESLQRMLARVQNLKPAFADIGEHLLNSHRKRWARQLSPDGVPWRLLSAAYLATKPKNTDKILVLDAYLRNRLRYHVASGGLRFGTNRVYGAVHQFGHGDIPARPYLGVSENDADEIAIILAEHIRID